MVNDEPKMAPLDPRGPENVFKECPHPLLIAYRLLCTPHRLTSLINLHFSSPHILFCQQSSCGIDRTFSSTAVVILHYLIRLAAVWSSYLDI